MQRRALLKTLAAGWLSVQLPGLAYALAPAGYRRLLVLVELKGGNDGLNTVIPYADADYYRLRPTLAIPREQVLPLDERTGLHPALQALQPLWQQNQLAIVQGVGYPEPNLSHFRSIDIWDTASRSDQTLSEGWLSRTFSRYPTGQDFAADGVILGSQTLGPLAGHARAVVLRDAASFARQARLVAQATPGHTPGALAHVLKVEDDIRHAASELASPPPAMDSPDSMGKVPAAPGAFGQSVATLLSTLDSGARIAVARLTLTGFDTHNNQAPTQQRLLGELASGLMALQQGLAARQRWQDTLVMSYAEFGRRPAENGNRGTDHGTANAHFVLGGQVRGGLYGAAPALAHLTDGNLPHAVDFRQQYATVLERWWGLPAADILGGRFTPMPWLA